MEIPGHGICEHKNIYSTNTLVGNWSEDIYGNYLKTNQIEYPTVSLSEAGAKYINPKLMDDKQIRNAPPSPPKPKDMSKHELFGHGLREAYDPNVPMQYVSMTDATLQGRMRTDEILAFKSNVYIDVDKPQFLLSRKLEKKRHTKEDVFNLLN